MPERASYAQGTPSWVDLPTTDQAAAKAFYAGLFGWTYDDQPMGEGQVYSMAILGGQQVAAISSQPAEMAAAGAPPMWNTYLAVDSVDEATAKVEAAGGKVAMAPFDVMDAGRMSFVMDPSGAPVALWQAGRLDLDAGAVWSLALSVGDCGVRIPVAIAGCVLAGAVAALESFLHRRFVVDDGGTGGVQSGLSLGELGADLIGVDHRDHLAFADPIIKIHIHCIDAPGNFCADLDLVLRLQRAGGVDGDG